MFLVKLLAPLVPLILLGGIWALLTREQPADHVPPSGKLHEFEMTWWWEEDMTPLDDPSKERVPEEPCPPERVWTCPDDLQGECCVPLDVHGYSSDRPGPSDESREF